VDESLASASLAEASRQEASLRPRPDRSRPGALAAAVAGAALLAGVAAGCSSSADGQHKSGGTAPATGVQAPAKIGSLTKASDDPAGFFKGEGLSSSVLKNLHSLTYYDHADNARAAFITGGAGLPVPSDGPDDKVARVMSRWLVDASIAHPVTVTSGSAGGTAECFPSAAQPKSLDCGWVNGNVALTLNFDGYSKSEIQALVPKILTAMVRT
jgi:hypothetical protein